MSRYMKTTRFLPCASVMLASAALAASSRAGGDLVSKDASPVYGVIVPDGYRRWELIAPALEAAPIDEIRAVVGNTTAIDAYGQRTLPFPDGAILVKLAWKQMQSAEFAPATVPGA